MTSEDQNIIYLYRELSADVVAEATLNILSAAADSQDPLYIILNSSGGELYAVLCFAELLVSLPNQVITIALGSVFSAALDLFLAGDVRVVCDSSAGLIHEVIYSIDESKHSDNVAMGKAIQNLLKSAAAFFASRTSLPSKRAEKLISTNTDIYLTAKEMLDMGIATHVLPSTSLKGYPTWDISTILQRARFIDEQDD